ncbi:MAG: ChaN family lipoprotein [Pseudobdellovibrio sp.]
MINKSILLLIMSLFIANTAFSQLFDGKTRAETDLTQLVSQVKPGTILFLGENHGLASHRDQHMDILNALRAAGLKLSVGMEFVNYTNQATLDQYRRGLINEAQFLAEIKWSGFGYEFYSQQINFPKLDLGELTLGLNIPRTLTTKISRNGLASLTEDEQKLMPPNFAVGGDLYKARFMEAAGSHCKNPDNCFAAHSAWDDTMAWQAVNFTEQHPDQVLVIVVGEFHVQYGGGTPARILVRKPNAQIVTLSQIWAEDMTDEEIQQAMLPSETEGPRADFIWVSKP